MFVIDTSHDEDNRFVNSDFRCSPVRPSWPELTGLFFVHGGGLTGIQPDSPRPAPKFVFSEAEEPTVAVAFAAAVGSRVVVAVAVDVVGAECSLSR